MSEITELKIAPAHSWKAVGPDNPLKCTVKVRSDKTVVETVLSPEDADRMLALVADIVAKAAAKNIADFSRAIATEHGDARLNASREKKGLDTLVDGGVDGQLC